MTIVLFFFSSTFSHVEDPLQLDEVIESFEDYQVLSKFTYNFLLHLLLVLSVWKIHFFVIPESL